MEAAGGVLVAEENMIVTTSPTLKPGTKGGGFEALAYTTPGQHSADPATLPSKGLHGVQLEALVIPGEGLKVPGGHHTHASNDGVPSASL
jgi:hypothetical protein